MFGVFNKIPELGNYFSKKLPLSVVLDYLNGVPKDKINSTVLKVTHSGIFQTFESSTFEIGENFIRVLNTGVIFPDKVYFVMNPNSIKLGGQIDYEGSIYAEFEIMLNVNI